MSKTGDAPLNESALLDAARGILRYGLLDYGTAGRLSFVNLSSDRLTVTTDDTDAPTRLVFELETKEGKKLFKSVCLEKGQTKTPITRLEYKEIHRVEFLLNQKAAMRQLDPV